MKDKVADARRRDMGFNTDRSRLTRLRATAQLGRWKSGRHKILKSFNILGIRAPLADCLSATPLIWAN
jgi:hypothetical protein